MIDDQNQLPDVREYLAAERTLLAYIRTGLAMMGFGFVVARFALFLVEVAPQPQEAPATRGWSLWFGVVLILLGVFLNFASVAEYRSLVRRLNRGQPEQWKPAGLPVLTAVALSVCGIAMAGYLIVTR